MFTVKPLQVCLIWSCLLQDPHVHGHHVRHHTQPLLAKQSQAGNPWFGVIIPLSAFQDQQSRKKSPSLLTKMTRHSQCKQAPKTWEIFNLLLNWERPECWAKPSGHTYGTANLKNLKTPLYISYWNVRISTHLSSDLDRWQHGTENPRWNLSLKWKILWQSQWKRHLNLKYNFYPGNRWTTHQNSQQNGFCLWN